MLGPCVPWFLAASSSVWARRKVDKTKELQAVQVKRTELVLRVGSSLASGLCCSLSPGLGDCCLSLGSFHNVIHSVLNLSLSNPWNLSGCNRPERNLRQSNDDPPCQIPQRQKDAQCPSTRLQDGFWGTSEYYIELNRVSFLPPPNTHILYSNR